MQQARKKPAVYLFVIMPVVFAGGAMVEVGSFFAYCGRAEVPLCPVPELNGYLIALPVGLLWLPIGLILSNFVLFIIPPLRQIAEQYASQAQRPNFWESQRILAKIVAFAAIICVPLIVLGFLL